MNCSLVSSCRLLQVGAMGECGEKNVSTATTDSVPLFIVVLCCIKHSYLRQAFSSLAHLYDCLSQALGGSWEGDVVLTPGLRALEKVRYSGVC